MSKLFDNEIIAGGQLHFTESVEIKPIVQNNEKLDSIKANLTESLKDKKLVLKPKIAAIHAGRTRNNTIYMEDKLRGSMVGEKGPSGMYSFLYPYNKPMLKNHDVESEPTGRIMNAQFVTTAEGSGFIMITPHITDQDTVEKLLDGRYLTVSIGATTDSAICNICGQDIIKDGWCDHARGETYDKTVCGWIIGNLWFDECSWVNVPADTSARVLDTSDSEIYAEVNKESYDVSNGMDIAESVAKELGLMAVVKESVSDESVILPETEKPIEEGDKPENIDTPTPVEETQEDTSTETPITATSEETPTGEADNTDAPKDTEDEDNKVNVEQENETKEKENASNSQHLVNVLNERILELESEVEDLEEKLEIQKAEYVELSNNFASFIKETIKENKEIIEEVDTDNLDNLSIKELTQKYNDLVSKTREKVSVIKKYKVSNTFLGIDNKEDLETTKPTKVETSKPIEVTPVEIYKTLLGGYKPKQYKEDI